MLSANAFNFDQTKILSFGKELIQMSNNPEKAFEINVGKGENAGDQHFLLFLQCFIPILEQICHLQFAFILDQSVILS